VLVSSPVAQYPRTIETHYRLH